MSGLRNLPNAQIQLERKEAERAGTAEESPVVTPLMEFIRQQRAAKGGPRYVPRNNCGKGSRSGKEKSTYVQITNGLSSVKYVGSPKHLRRRGPQENLQSLSLEVEFWFLVLSVSSFMNGLVSSDLESKRRLFLPVYLEKEDLLTWVLDLIVLIRRHDFSKSLFNDQTVIVCDQCEREYHIRCLREQKMADLEALPKGRWFCKEDCERIHYVLQDLLIREPEIVHEELSNVVSVGTLRMFGQNIAELPIVGDLRKRRSAMMTFKGTSMLQKDIPHHEPESENGEDSTLLINTHDT
ncbi:hypothetical protein LXL04_031342 [Taraxacum kok-saghyz]